MHHSIQMKFKNKLKESSVIGAGMLTPSSVGVFGNGQEEPSGVVEAFYILIWVMDTGGG